MTIENVYIAGPMRGIDAYNFTAFFEAEELVADKWPGARIMNPAREDCDRFGLWHTLDQTKANFPAQAGHYLQDHPEVFDSAALRESMGHDLDFVTREADVIVLLPGFSNSKGARAEIAAGQAVGVRFFAFIGVGPDGSPLPLEMMNFIEVTGGPLERYLTHADLILGESLKAEPVDKIEVRSGTGEVITTAVTGGQKGVKPERHSLIPKPFLDALGRVYGYGANKYAAHNWRRRYEFSKSLDALDRHVAAFTDGETYDPESGEHHLAHAAFHLAALITWITEDGEGVNNPMDDRWRSALARLDQQKD